MITGVVIAVAIWIVVHQPAQRALGILGAVTLCVIADLEIQDVATVGVVVLTGIRELITFRFS